MRTPLAASLFALLPWFQHVTSANEAPPDSCEMLILHIYVTSNYSNIVNIAKLKTLLMFASRGLG